MRITTSLPLLPGPLWLRVVAPDRIISMGQIELFDISTECKQMTYAKSIWFLFNVISTFAGYLIPKPSF